MSLLLLFNQPAGSVGPPASLTHPHYSVVWDSDLQFILGSSGPLRFIFSRYDGQNVVLPTTATVTITLPGGVTPVTITPDVEASGAALQQVLACDYLFAARGIYTVKILAMFGNEIVGAAISIICDN